MNYELETEGHAMAYLEPADYPNYGLPAGTTADWITAATALINSYCRRPDLNVIQYIERLRVTAGAQTVRLSYLPLAPLASGDLAAGEHRGPLRPAAARERLRSEPLSEIAWAFALPGQWTAIDPTLVDFDREHGRADAALECAGAAIQRGAGDVYGRSRRRSATT